MNARRAVAAVVCLIAVSVAALAQQRVDPLNMYYRVWAIVPYTGQGTVADPKRPLHAPAPAAISPSSPTGIAGWIHVPSDDGKFALVEYVARDKASLAPILADATIQAFSINNGVGRPAAIAAFQKLKKNFDFSHFGVRVP